MWWKTVLKWVRDRVDVDVDLDLDGRTVAVAATVKFNEAVLLSERFEWPLPTPGRPAKLASKAARRRSLLPEGT